MRSEFETVVKTAYLARMKISAEEAKRLGAQFAAILDAFRVLSELDTEGVEPMTGATDLSDVLRDDRERPSLPSERLLANAPQRIGEFYGVPKTVGGVE